jgi:hypothetical protein
MFLLFRDARRPASHNAVVLDGAFMNPAVRESACRAAPLPETAEQLSTGYAVVGFYFESPVSPLSERLPVPPQVLQTVPSERFPDPRHTARSSQGQESNSPPSAWGPRT